MKLYLPTLFISIFVVAILNTIFIPVGYDVLAVWLYTWINAIVIFVLDIIVATVIHALPRKWFDPYKKIFHVYKWENKFLTKGLKILEWKDKIPELGKLTTIESSLKGEGINPSSANFSISGICCRKVTCASTTDVSSCIFCRSIVTISSFTSNFNF